MTQKHTDQSIDAIDAFLASVPTTSIAPDEFTVEMFAERCSKVGKAMTRAAAYNYLVRHNELGTISVRQVKLNGRICNVYRVTGVPATKPK